MWNMNDLKQIKYKENLSFTSFLMAVKAAISTSQNISAGVLFLNL